MRNENYKVKIGSVLLSLIFLIGSIPMAFASNEHTGNKKELRIEIASAIRELTDEKGANGEAARCLNSFLAIGKSMIMDSKKLQMGSVCLSALFILGLVPNATAVSKPGCATVSVIQNGMKVIGAQVSIISNPGTPTFSATSNTGNSGKVTFACGQLFVNGSYQISAIIPGSTGATGNLFADSKGSISATCNLNNQTCM